MKKKGKIQPCTISCRWDYQTQKVEKKMRAPLSEILSAHFPWPSSERRRVYSCDV